MLNTNFHEFFTIQKSLLTFLLLFFQQNNLIGFVKIRNSVFVFHEKNVMKHFNNLFLLKLFAEPSGHNFG